MASQSANDLCLSLLVHSGDHAVLLRAAHEALIPPAGDNPDGVFGASWMQMQLRPGSPDG
jgi:hypothetical protein